MNRALVLRHRTFRQRIISVMSIAFLSVIISVCQSQAQESNYGSDFSLFLGHMLPNQIEGVTEILPVFGGRYAYPLSSSAIEVGLGNSHAYGVDFTSLDISLRGEIPAAEGMVGLIYGGASLNWYSEQDESERQLVTGFHLGGAGMMLVSDTLWLRSDLKFVSGPGTSLSILFGLVFRGRK